MNENIDLTKILEGCPEGTKFYSSNYGEVALVGIIDNNYYPVKVVYFTKLDKSSATAYVTKDGRDDYNANGECTFFPSKDQRNWSKFERFWDKSKVEKFDPKTLRPFDKVLGFYEVEGGSWECNIFSHLIGKECSAVCTGIIYNKYIPYNEETKHLIGTNDDCPEYYKWWEK